MHDPDAMTALEVQWKRAARALVPCCGPLVFKYEPGCTFCRCAGCERKVAVPDWDPEGCREEWNACRKTVDAP